MAQILLLQVFCKAGGVAKTEGRCIFTTAFYYCALLPEICEAGGVAKTVESSEKE